MHCQLIFFVTLLGGFAPPAARANLRSVFHSIGLRNTAEKLHFYLELTYYQDAFLVVDFAKSTLDFILLIG